MSEIEELMHKYETLFDDLFPLWCTQGMDEADIAAAIRDCIESGEPYAIDGEVFY